MAYCTKCGQEIPAGASYCPNCGQSISQQQSSTQLHELDNLARDPQLQEHWLHRLIAFVIDWLIVTVALSILSFLVFVSIGRLASFNPLFVFSFLPVVPSVGASLVLVIYFSIAEGFYGKTIGKSLLHMHVVMVNGTRLDLGKAFVRNVSKIYWLLLLLDILIGMISQTKRGQKYSDYILNTNVVLEP